LRQVTVVYHYEDGNWWADSPDPGLSTFVAGGQSLAETRRLAREGAAFHLDVSKVRLVERFEPQHVLTHLEVATSLPAAVYGGPASSGSPRTKVTITPAQPLPVAS
jgi:predicted RNase H-like HicB family nuclease